MVEARSSVDRRLHRAARGYDRMLKKHQGLGITDQAALSVRVTDEPCGRHADAERPRVRFRVSPISNGDAVSMDSQPDAKQ